MSEEQTPAAAEKAAAPPPPKPKPPAPPARELPTMEGIADFMAIKCILACSPAPMNPIVWESCRAR